MTTQNYANHSRFPASPFRLVAFFLLLNFLAAVLNLYEPFLLAGKLWSIVLVSATLGLILMWYSLRQMIVRVQDRAIRAEENLRHFIITGKPLPSEISLGQIVALRFASDTEFANLALRAATEKLSSKAIKKLIQNWRADLNRAQ